MHSDNKLNNTDYSGKRDKLSDETQRLMPVPDLSSSPSKAGTGAYPAVSSHEPEKFHTIKTITWDRSDLEDQAEFAKKYLSQLLRENDRGPIKIAEKVVAEIKNIIPPFQTNIDRYYQARDQAEISGLDIDGEKFNQLSIQLRKNLLTIQACLNKINISLRNQYNETIKTEKESSETSRSETSYPVTSKRVEVTAVPQGHGDKELDNLRKSISDATSRLARAESDQERGTWLETLSVLAGAQARKKEEMEKAQRMPQISA